MIFRVRAAAIAVWRIQQVLNLQRKDSDSRKFAVTIVHGFATQRKISVVIGTSTRRLARSVVRKMTRRQALHRKEYGAMEGDGLGSNPRRA